MQQGVILDEDGRNNLRASVQRQVEALAKAMELQEEINRAMEDEVSGQAGRVTATSAAM